MTTALEGGEGSASRPGRSLPPGKTLYPLYMRLGGPPGLVWTGAENLAPIGFRSPYRPTRSQLLYRLSYPAHNHSKTVSSIYIAIRHCLMTNLNVIFILCKSLWNMTVILKFFIVKALVEQYNYEIPFNNIYKSISCLRENMESQKAIISLWWINISFFY